MNLTGTVPTRGLVLHHGARGNRLRRTRKAMGSFRFAISSAFRPRRRGRCARAGSEGIPSNGFSASREAGFGVFRGRSADCLRFNLACNLTGTVPSRGLVLYHGARGNRLRRTRKAIGSFRFAIASAFRPRRGRYARAGSEGIPSNGFSVSREAGFGVFRGRSDSCQFRSNIGFTWKLWEAIVQAIKE